MAGFGGRNTLALPLRALVSGVDYPADNPGSQSGWFAFSPPASTFSPLGTPPILSVITNDGNKNNVLQVAGYNFASSTKFRVYGQTDAGSATTDIAAYPSTNFLRFDASKNLAMIVVPSGQVDKAMYMVWPGDAANYHYPLFVNKTEAWSLQDTRGTGDTGTGHFSSCIIGHTISVYGVNLCNRAGTPLTWIYLQPRSGGRGGFVSSTSVKANGKRVQFTLPSTIGTHGALADGDIFDVWIHNGHGQAWGWSKCKTPLTVRTTATAGANVAGSGLDYTPHNGGTALTASGDTTGATDYATLSGIIAGATTAKSITLGSGTWYLNQPLDLIGGTGGGHSKSILLIGQGAGSTTIKPNTTGTAYSNTGNFMSSDGQDVNSGVKALTIDTTGISFATNTEALRIQRVVACTLTTPGNVAIACEPSGIRAYVVDSTITARELFYVNPLSVYIDNCTFNTQEGSTAPGGQAAAAIVLQGTFGNFPCGISGNTVQNSNDSPGSDSTHGVRAVLMVDSISRAYIGDLITINLAPFDNVDNRGEQILFEGSSNNYSPTSGCSSDGSTGVTIARLGWAAIGQVVLVISGKGANQFGKVTAINHGTVTGATNANPIQITSTAHGLITGEHVTITGVNGNTAANVTNNAVTVVDADHFTLNGIAGNGAYTSGGAWTGSTATLDRLWPVDVDSGSILIESSAAIDIAVSDCTLDGRASGTATASCAFSFNKACFNVHIDNPIAATDMIYGFQVDQDGAFSGASGLHAYPVLFCVVKMSSNHSKYGCRLKGATSNSECSIVGLIVRPATGSTIFAQNTNNDARLTSCLELVQRSSNDWVCFDNCIAQDGLAGVSSQSGIDSQIVDVFWNTQLKRGFGATGASSKGYPSSGVITGNFSLKGSAIGNTGTIADNYTSNNLPP